MATGDAEKMAEMPETHPEGSGRNPRVYGTGASNVTVRRDLSHPEATQLMEAVVERGNMHGPVSLLDQLHRVQSTS